MRRPSAGFSLLEVLVAVLLLAVGLAGAVAMQAHAMRSRQESALLTGALATAAALADRMRANSAQSSAYLGFEFDAATTPAPPAPAACLDAPCDGGALAQRELAEAAQAVARDFPAGRVRVCRDSAAWSAEGLRWSCSGETAAPLVIKIGWRSRNPDGTHAASSPGIALAVALSDAGGKP